jgi:hypothetical protein
MEYVVTANRPFEVIEAQTVDALERQGFLVRCTFSLRSAAGLESGGLDGSPGYTVLMLYQSADERQPLALVTLYEGQGRMVIESLLAPPTSRGPHYPSQTVDVEAEVAAALSLGGVDFCVGVVRGAGCVDPRQVDAHLPG